MERNALPSAYQKFHLPTVELPTPKDLQEKKEYIFIKKHRIHKPSLDTELDCQRFNDPQKIY